MKRSKLYEIFGGKNKVVLESERGDNQWVVFQTIEKFRSYGNYNTFKLEEIRDINQDGVEYLRYKATISVK